MPYVPVPLTHATCTMLCLRASKVYNTSKDCVVARKGGVVELSDECDVWGSMNGRGLAATDRGSKAMAT